MSGLAQFHVLEINLISAQDLAKVSRSMKTYAMAWVHPDRKLTTRIDTNGATNPTWNDKFIFRVDDQFLKSDTSAVMIEIYAVHWFRDIHVGTVRVLVGNLIPPQTRAHNINHIGMRFVALQVRRPSGRPQGILNIGVTVLDSTMRSMPLYTQLSASAVGYQTLMGHEELRSHDNNTAKGSGTTQAKAQLRRSKSERSSMLELKPSSSIIYEFDTGPMIRNRNNKENIDGSMYDEPLSVVDGRHQSLAIKLKAQKGKADSILGHDLSTKWEVKRPRKKGPSSVVSKSDLGSIPPLLRHINHPYRKGKGPKKPASDVGVGGTKTSLSSQETTPANYQKNKQQQQPPLRHQRGGRPIVKDFAAGSIWSESEVGPSPSEVAAAIAEDSKYRRYDDGRSSMMDDKWSMDESEGVMTKLERWRTQMPPQYEYDGRSTDGTSSIFPTKHRRRHTDGDNNNGSSKFSCFGNICGYECSIVCGQHSGNGNHKNKHRRNSANKHAARAPSLDSIDHASYVENLQKHYVVANAPRIHPLKVTPASSKRGLLMHIESS
ncbi:hypothetical protein Cgig2_030085 [Carnegiea gigantea]|uniref:C2 domain-containing protein n=1 Tax=Carnegiea gigantea TaxID=171969 RepID=A0A9Q1GRJ4_9CARY|nr:hypothetical protein Cgig2_030085 [Carnegiea gigantea]